MENYQNVFQRVEEKYIFNKDKYNELMDRLKDKIEPNEYPNSTILNLYFDNDNYDLAIKSIQKPVFKEKVRLRSYNVPKDDSKLFWELKVKYKGIVMKRRIAITKSQYEEYLKTGNIVELQDNQIFKEIDYTIKKFNLRPRIMVTYDRDAYYLKENHNIRITFDFNLRSRFEGMDLYLGDAGKKFFSKDMCILEVKSFDSMPIWLAELLNELKIYPTSFSKVGEVYKQMISNNMKNKEEMNLNSKDEIA